MENEPALLNAAKKFDRDALVTIFDQYASAIYRYALRLCHDPLESGDMVSEVFSAFSDQLAAGKGPSTSLRAYLYQLVYHLIMDHAYQRKRFIVFEATMDMAIKLPSSSQAKVEQHVLMESAVSALKNNLNELEKHVIILRFLEGFSLQETATIISKSANRVREIQKCGIEKLRKSLRFLFEKDKHN